MKRSLAIIAALCCAQAFAYVGTFDPLPQRHVVTITFIDSQAAGASCAIHSAQKLSPLYALAAPLMVHLAACAITDPPTVIAPISIGPGSLYALQMLATPDALLGHETRHIFDGQFHPTFIPFLELNRLPNSPHSRTLPGDQHD